MMPAGRTSWRLYFSRAATARRVWEARIACVSSNPLGTISATLQRKRRLGTVFGINADMSDAASPVPDEHHQYFVDVTAAKQTHKRKHNINADARKSVECTYLNAEDETKQ